MIKMTGMDLPLKVQLTNDFSIVSKYSMVNQGYFNDHFIRYFANKLVRRTPIVNLGYFVRARIIDDVLSYYASSASKMQVLSLGAGYDTAYFRLNKKSLLKYVEIDLNDVVRNKIEIIRNTPCLLQQMSNLKCLDCGINSENYALIAQNLNDLDQLESKLKMIDFVFDSFVLILSECSITYMEEVKSTQLIQWVARKCPNSVFINYEQIRPEDGFGRIMRNHFVSVGNPIKSVEKYRTTDEQRMRYLTAAFEKCVSMSAMDVIDESFSSQFTHCLQLEPFDEWEELHATCSHYALTVASNTVDLPLYLSQTSSVPSSSGSVIACEFDVKTVIQRFGHSSMTVCNESIIVGGFGLLGGNGRHGRLEKMELIRNETSQIRVEGDSVTNDCLYSRCVAIDDQSFAIYGGRTSPKREVNTQMKIAHCRPGNNSLTINYKSVQECKLPPRWRHTLSFCSGYIVIFGGRNSKMDVYGDLWIYDLVEQKWYSWSIEEIVNDLNGPRPRFSHSDAVCLKRNEVFISGGLDRTFKPMNDIFVSKIRKQKNNDPIAEWTRMKCIPEMKPRYGHTSHVSGNSFILVGGSNNDFGELPEVCVVNLENLNSVEYKIQISVQKPILLHSHTSELSKPHEITIYGGGGNCFAFGTFYNANPIRIQLPLS